MKKVKAFCFFVLYGLIICLSHRVEGVEYVTNPARSDGFGAQFQTIIYSVIYAELTNKQFVYTPFIAMEHNYDNSSDFLEKKELLINFRDHFELNNGLVAQPYFGDFWAFFEQNLSACVASKALKKIKTIFRENKNRNLFFDESYFNIAIHIRRLNAHDSRVDGTDDSDDYYLNVIDKLRKKYSNKKTLFHLYSQGDLDAFQQIYKAPDIIFHINESLEDTFTAMVLADALITARSSLSYVAGLLSEGIIYYHNFWCRPLVKWRNVEAL